MRGTAARDVEYGLIQPDNGGRDVFVHISAVEKAGFTVLAGGAEVAQAQQSAACMAVHAVESRLYRWLLRAHDLAETDTLHFNQEYVAEMLGVQRTSVTLVARTPQQAGMIRYSRSRIQLVDIEAMREAVCECYGTVQSHYEALLAQPAR